MQKTEKRYATYQKLIKICQSNIWYGKAFSRKPEAHIMRMLTSGSNEILVMPPNKENLEFKKKRSLKENVTDSNMAVNEKIDSRIRIQNNRSRSKATFLKNSFIEQVTELSANLSIKQADRKKKKRAITDLQSHCLGNVRQPSKESQKENLQQSQAKSKIVARQSASPKEIETNNKYLKKKQTLFRMFKGKSSHSQIDSIASQMPLRQKSNQVKVYQIFKEKMKKQKNQNQNKKKYRKPDFLPQVVDSTPKRFINLNAKISAIPKKKSAKRTKTDYKTQANVKVDFAKDKTYQKKAKQYLSRCSEMLPDIYSARAPEILPWQNQKLKPNQADESDGFDKIFS